MNSALGNVGKTVFYSEPLEVNSVDQRQSLTGLMKDLDSGRVELLVIFGGNPVYNTPTDLRLIGKAEEGEATGSSQPVQRRNQSTMSLAHPAGSLSRVMGRRKLL